ncbi:hypothetical protein DIPPA_57491, partial [Diplonema papillatum]
MQRMPGLVLLLAGLTEAHISIVCTATTSSQPDSFAFWFGTYHPAPTDGSVPGQAHIKAPDGNVLTADFTDFCEVDLALPGDKTVDDFTETIKTAACLALEDSDGNHGVFADSTITCFKGDPSPEEGNPDNHAVAVTGEDSPVDCYELDNLITWYLVVIPGAESGRYETWTTDTDTNLDPGEDAMKPCSMGAASTWFFDISVTKGSKT